METTAGSWLGEWALEAEIGHGGFSRVFRARRGGQGEPVAIKVARGAHGAEVLRSTAPGLDHPRIVKTLERALDHDPPYVVLELVAGGSLRDRLRAGRLPPREALRVVSDVAAALDHAHARGVLHLDVKPENVLLAHDGARLADFGGARLDDPGPLAHSLALSEELVTAGTRDYAAPELREAAAPGSPPGRVDRRADVYGLGVLAYELLTGRLPLGLDRPSEVQPDLPRAVDDALAHALARAPERRTLSCGALLAELTGALEPRPAPARPQARASGAHPRPGPARRGVGGRVALAGVLLSLGLWAAAPLLPARDAAWSDPGASVDAPALERVVERVVRGRRPLALGVDDLAGGHAGLGDLLLTTGGEAEVAALRSGALFTRAGRDELVRRADVGLHLVVTGDGPRGWLFEVDLATADLVSAARLDPSDAPVVPAAPGSVEASAAQVGRLLALLLAARSETRPLVVLPAVDRATGASNRTSALFDAHLAAALVEAPGRRAPVRARFGLVERLRELPAWRARAAGPALGSRQAATAAPDGPAKRPAAEPPVAPGPAGPEVAARGKPSDVAPGDADLVALVGVSLAVESRIDAARGAVEVALRDLERGEEVWTASAPLDLREYDPGLDAARLSVDPAAVERVVTTRLERLWRDHVDREVARACARAEALLEDQLAADARDLLDGLRARGAAWTARVEPELLRARAWAALRDDERAASVLEDAIGRFPEDPRPHEALGALALGEARRLFLDGKRPWYRDDDEQAFRAARAWLDRAGAARLAPHQRAQADRLREAIDREL